jgi:hypothetical protein
MLRIAAVITAVLALPLAVAAAQWSWKEATVGDAAGAVVLLYGPADADPSSWTAAARVGRPRGTVFPVEWLVDAKAVGNQTLVEAVSFELDSYLKDAGRPDPWSYVQYHCQTTSNWYGDVHWACP